MWWKEYYKIVELLRKYRKIFEKSVENNRKPLVKCSSSLYVVTSKDSLNAEVRTEYITDNQKSQPKGDQKKRMRIHNKTNKNLTISVDESSSVFEVDDVISSVFEDTKSPYQCSMCAYPSPDMAVLHKNSSCVSGHFVERLPDLDLSPIPNLSPKKTNHDQFLKTKLCDKDVQEAESKDTGQGSSDKENFSRSSSNSQKGSGKSFERFLTCLDHKTDSFGENAVIRMHSEIPKFNFTSEEAAFLTKSNALDIAGSKIPIPVRKLQVNIFAEIGLHDTPRKSNTVRTDHKTGNSNS